MGNANLFKFFEVISYSILRRIVNVRKTLAVLFESLDFTANYAVEEFTKCSEVDKLNNELLPFYKQQTRRIISEANTEFLAKFVQITLTFSCSFLAWVRVYFAFNTLKT